MTRDPSTWFRESVSENLYQECKISGVVYSGQSEYQTIEIFDTLAFGRESWSLTARPSPRSRTSSSTTRCLSIRP